MKTDNDNTQDQKKCEVQGDQKRRSAADLLLNEEEYPNWFHKFWWLNGQFYSSSSFQKEVQFQACKVMFVTLL